MEKELNIAAILKDKPQNTRLWSPIFGDVYLKDVTDVNNNMIRITHHGVDNIFMNNGKVWTDGDVCLFPSRCMDDWQKFAWKKGDVLVSNEGDVEVIFDKWYDDTYTNFYGKHYLDSENENNIKYFEGFVCITERYFLESKDTAQTYINTIEERLGGKLNLETLEIEQPKPEFKDGDIAFADFGNTQNVFIISGKTDLSEGYSSFISLSLKDLTLSMGNITTFFKKDLCKLRLAIEEEKRQLFDALAKEGKVWNAEKKQVVDLKIKWMDLKPFDKVITRVDVNAIWTANIFSHMDSYGKYVTTGFAGSYPYCLPYNEETAHLIGTNDEWKGGEG